MSGRSKGVSFVFNPALLAVGTGAVLSALYFSYTKIFEDGFSDDETRLDSKQQNLDEIKGYEEPKNPVVSYIDSLIIYYEEEENIKERATKRSEYESNFNDGDKLTTAAVDNENDPMFLLGDDPTSDIIDDGCGKECNERDQELPGGITSLTKDTEESGSDKTSKDEWDGEASGDEDEQGSSEDEEEEEGEAQKIIVRKSLSLDSLKKIEKEMFEVDDGTKLDLSVNYYYYYHGEKGESAATLLGKSPEYINTLISLLVGGHIVHIRFDQAFDRFIEYGVGLLDALKESESLKEISIRCYKMTNKTATAIAEILESSDKLEKLEIAGPMAVEEGVIIAEALKNLDTLKTLIISDRSEGGIAAGAATALVRAEVEKAKEGKGSLEELILVGPDVDDEISGLMAELLRLNHKLSVLKLNGLGLYEGEDDEDKVTTNNNNLKKMLARIVEELKKCGLSLLELDFGDYEDYFDDDDEIVAISNRIKDVMNVHRYLRKTFPASSLEMLGIMKRMIIEILDEQGKSFGQLDENQLFAMLVLIYKICGLEHKMFYPGEGLKDIYQESREELLKRWEKVKDDFNVLISGESGFHLSESTMKKVMRRMHLNGLFIAGCLSYSPEDELSDSDRDKEVVKIRREAIHYLVYYCGLESFVNIDDTNIDLDDAGRLLLGSLIENLPESNGNGGLLYNSYLTIDEKNALLNLLLDLVGQYGGKLFSDARGKAIVIRVSFGLFGKESIQILLESVDMKTNELRRSLEELQESKKKMEYGMKVLQERIEESSKANRNTDELEKRLADDYIVPLLELDMKITNVEKEIRRKEKKLKEYKDCFCPSIDLGDVFQKLSDLKDNLDDLIENGDADSKEVEAANKLQELINVLLQSKIRGQVRT